MRWVIVNPPASCVTSTTAATGSTGLFAAGGAAVTLGLATGTHPRATHVATHGMARTIAVTGRVLLRARMFHSVVNGGRRRLRRLAWLARRRIGEGGGDLRHGRSIRVCVDRAQETTAQFLFRVATRHHHGESAKAL